MPNLTLGRVKQYLSDISNQMSDDTAGRLFTRFVQDALRELDRAHSWDHLRTRGTVAPDNSIKFTTGLTVTQGSRKFVLTTGTWLQQWVDEEWELEVAGETRQHYRLVEIDGGDPTIAYSEPGQPWAQVSATNVAYNMVRSIYPFPNGDQFKRIHRIELVRENIVLDPVSIEEFEDYRQVFPDSKGDSWVYTTHGSETFSIWPPANGGIKDYLRLDYQRRIRLPEEGDVDDSLVDWPFNKEDLLRSALKIQVLDHLGGEAVPFDAGQAIGRWREILSGHKDVAERTKEGGGGKMRLRSGSVNRPTFRSWIRGSVIP